jgi:hypothetical protein
MADAGATVRGEPCRSMGIREDALLQLRTFTTGRLSSHSFRCWFEASEGRFVEIGPDDDVMRLLGEARAALGRYDGAELRERLLERVRTAGLTELLALPKRPTAAPPG